MADSVLYQIEQEIQNRVAQDFSVSPYISGFDMTGLCEIGVALEPQRCPFASVDIAGSRSERARVQCKYKTTAIFEVYLIATGKGRAERSKNIKNLATDVINSICKESNVLNNRLSGQIDDVIPSVNFQDGIKEYKGKALALIQLEITYLNTIGM